MTQISTQPTPPQPAPAPGDGPRPVVVGCQQLTKVFKDFWMRDRARAVDKLDLVIHEREVFGLLGPNGSGKSTTIKLILGLLRPTSGRVAVFGKSPTDVGIKKRIGYLPEESYLYPFLNARETLDYYAKLFGLDHKSRAGRIDELLHMVGLEHAQFRPVREYSKGMQRRIGIAQALINDPDLLILDEPTTGLDPIGTRQVKDLILELGRRGKTVILSSHLLSDVEDVVDRMAILYGGKMRGEGTCEALLASTERTLIETDELDEQTIAEIDEVIRRRSGGEKSIRGVKAPRQKLEELFLGIVEKAQNERASTSGAMRGGATAAFLRDGDTTPRRGDSLIESLMGENDAPAPIIETRTPDAPDSTGSSEDGREHPAIAHEAGEDEAGISDTSEKSDTSDEPDTSDMSVIGALLEHEQDQGEAERQLGAAGSAAPAQSEDQVDLGMIGSLLDDDDHDGDDNDNTDTDGEQRRDGKESSR